MLEKMEKHKGPIILVIFLVLFSLRWIPFKSVIDETYETTVYQINDPNYHKITEVRIIGEYSHYLTRDDKFVGRIDVGDSINRDGDLKTTLYINNELQRLDYLEVNNGVFVNDRLMIGNIFMTNKMEDVIIFPYKVEETCHYTWSSVDGYFIDVNSSNRTEALEKAKRVLKIAYGQKIESYEEMK